MFDLCIYTKKADRITAVTRNCCFSVSCSSFFPIFVCGNGEISVTKPQLRVAAKRYKPFYKKPQTQQPMKLFDDKKITIIIISFVIGLIFSGYLIYDQQGVFGEKDIITLGITVQIPVILTTQFQFKVTT